MQHGHFDLSLDAPWVEVAIDIWPERRSQQANPPKPINGYPGIIDTGAQSSVIPFGVADALGLIHGINCPASKRLVKGVRGTQVLANEYPVVLALKCREGGSTLHLKTAALEIEGVDEILVGHDALDGTCMVYDRVGHLVTVTAPRP